MNMFYHRYYKYVFRKITSLGLLIILIERFNTYKNITRSDDSYFTPATARDQNGYNYLAGSSGVIPPGSFQISECHINNLT